MRILSIIPILYVVCFSLLYILNGNRFLKESKEFNLTVILAAYTAVTVIKYGLYLSELFIAWYGGNEYESCLLGLSSAPAILTGTLLSLAPLLGWIKPIQSNLIIYTLILSVSGIWLIVSHMKIAT